MQTEENKLKSNVGIGIVSALIILAFAVILIVPQSREVFGTLSGAHPMIMGFVKFALLATIGELIAMRISQKAWLLPSKLIWRMLIWGLIGAVLALLLKMYSGGVTFLLSEGILPGGDISFVRAFATSVFMNATFGPVMMGFHKMTDTYLALSYEKKGGIKLADVIDNVNWQVFVRFVLLRTIPIFWIPAHTITFMLPPEFQTIMAAFLSIALGIILSLKKK